MKSRFTFFLLMAISSLAVKAQETPRTETTVRNRIGIALGIGHVRWTDRNSSPLTYKSIPKNVRLFYNLEAEDVIITFDIDVRVGGIRSLQHPDRTVFLQEEDYKGKKEDKKFPVGGSFIAAKVALGAFYKTSNDSKAQTAVGIRVQEEMFYPQGWVSSGMFNAFSFAPAFMGRRIDERHAFTATVSLPVAAYLTRLPYDNTVSAPDKTLVEGFFRNGSWQGVGKFFAPAVGLNYQYQMNDHWSSGLNYEITGYSISQPRLMKALSQSLQANLSNTF